MIWSRLHISRFLLLFFISIILPLPPGGVCFKTLTCFQRTAVNLNMASSTDIHSKEKLEKAEKLVDWLISNGGYVNPKCSVVFSQ